MFPLIFCLHLETGRIFQPVVAHGTAALEGGERNGMAALEDPQLAHIVRRLKISLIGPLGSQLACSQRMPTSKPLLSLIVGRLVEVEYGF